MTGDNGDKLTRTLAGASTNAKLGADPKLDISSQNRIGDQLRAMYDELMQQPVPDKFKDLLDRLDKGPVKKEGSQ